MIIDYATWLNLIIRWAHIIVGIGWIGASFYFVALDYSLRKQGDQDDGVMGEAWQVHGGGFYHVKKFMVAPDELPEHLIWYKWDAYLTWITGFALLAVQYYLSADVYLIDPSKVVMSEGVAVGLSVVTLIAGWVIYDLICRLTQNQSALVTAILVFIFLIAAAYLYTNIYSGRGALIHVGAMIGTMMAVNVFGVIIPNQKKIVASLIAGEAPDPRLGKIGKQRSLHNNYLTLPVLLMMVSNHYPILSSHTHTWLVVALIIIVGACIRHLINRHEAGDELKSFIWALPVAAVCFLAVVIFTAPRPLPAPTAGTSTAAAIVSDVEALAIVQTHCGACHAPIEGFEEYFVPPKDIRLVTVDDLVRYRAQIRDQSVLTKAMPMGNPTGMTDEERAQLGAWLASQ